MAKMDQHYVPPSKFEEDFAKDPSKVGFCTFAEFRKNPDKWRPNKDQLLRSVDKGANDPTLKGVIREHRYFLEGYRCGSLEKVESMAIEMGIALNQLKGQIVRQQLGGGKERMDIHFMSTDTINKRKDW